MPSLNGQDLVETVTPSTPPSGRLALYPKSNHLLYIKDSTGLETQIGAQGPQGIQGIQGVQGVKGDTGATGSQGPQGNPGATGSQGPTGNTGSQGPQGNPGTQGIQGIPGNPGSVWFTGSGAPAGATGIIGDYYLNSANGDYYTKTGASTWTLSGNIKGPTGNTGSTGSQGIQGIQGIQGLQGIPGTAGALWYTGSGAPLTGTGIVGDFYINSANGDYYSKTGSSTWTLQGNLKGPQGATGSTGSTGSQGIQGIQGIQGNTGAPGSKWFSAAGVPASGTGIVGDWDLNTTNGDYYEKTGASTWTLRGNLTGPQGIQGPIGNTGSQGIQGNTGAAGSKWYNASGAPSGALGVIGDWYLNSTNGDYYEKTGASAWTLRGNLTGPTGPQGIQGIQGNPGAPGSNGSTGPQGNAGAPGAKWYVSAGSPSGATGIIGDFHLNSNTGDVSEKTGASAWTLRDNLTGPQGIQGIQGIPGPTGNTGSQGPQGNVGATGSQGPQGLKGDPGATGSQGPQGIKGDTGNTGAQGIQGIQGIQGVSGTPGEQWFTGSGVPSTGLGIIGDFYLNITNGDVYEKTGPTVWTFTGNIKGPQGIQGVQGIQGIQGPIGNTGAQGPIGNTGPTGNTGPQGATGSQGVKGDTGSQGPMGQGVHPGGLTGECLVKASNADFDTAWQLIDASQVAILQQQVNVLEVKVAELQAQIAALQANPVFPGPQVGVAVHLKNNDGDCVEAIIYEDYTRRNNPNTISVVYVDPDNPTWLKRADVKEQNGTLSDVPFNNWHMPEWTITPDSARRAYASRKS